METRGCMVTMTLSNVHGLRRLAWHLDHCRGKLGGTLVHLAAPQNYGG